MNNTNTDAVNTYKYAISLSQNGQIQEAILALDSAIQIDNNFIEAWFLKGNILDDTGNYNAAIMCFNKVLSINPNLPTVWFNRAMSMLNSQRYQETVESANKAVELSPNFYQAWNTKASALQMLSRHNEAITSYVKAIKIKPDDEVTIQNLLGLFLMVANDDRVLQKISDEDMKVIEKIVQSLKK